MSVVLREGARIKFSLSQCIMHRVFEQPKVCNDFVPYQSARALIEVLVKTKRPLRLRNFK